MQKQKKQSKLKRSNIIDIPIYDSMFHRFIHVFVGEQGDSYNKIKNIYKTGDWIGNIIRGKEFKDYFFDSSGCTMSLMDSSSEKESIIIVWVNTVDDDSLVHELSHVSAIILFNAGINHDIENQETFAYFIGNLYKEVIDTYKEEKEKE